MNHMPSKHDQHNQQAPDFHSSCTIEAVAVCACDAATVPTCHAGHRGHVLTLGEQPALAVKVADTFSEVGQEEADNSEPHRSWPKAAVGVGAVAAAKQHGLARWHYDQRGSANRLKLQDAHR